MHFQLVFYLMFIICITKRPCDDRQQACDGSPNFTSTRALCYTTKALCYITVLTFVPLIIRRSRRWSRILLEATQRSSGFCWESRFSLPEAFAECPSDAWNVPDEGEWQPWRRCFSSSYFTSWRTQARSITALIGTIVLLVSEEFSIVNA